MLSCKILLGVVCACIGCTALSAADDAPEPARRYSFGARIEYLTTPLFRTYYGTASTTNPISSSVSIATTHTPRFTLVPLLEFRLTSHVSAQTELHFRHAQYQEVTYTTFGVQDPNSPVDDRRMTTVRLTNKINYWEIPLLANYYGLRRSGVLRRLFVTAGAELRHVGRVRTGTEYSNADNTYDYNENPALSLHSNQIGLVAGVGLRSGTLFHLRAKPEIRYIQWQGTLFDGTAYRSAHRQLQVGMGLVF